MSKKLFAALMALAAIGAFAAASASANPILTQPTGTIVPTGTAITAQSVGTTVMTTGLGNVVCDTATMSGTLTTNSTASGSKGDVTSASFHNIGSTECSSWTGGVTVTPGVAGGLPWCLEATTATDEGKVRGGKCSELARGIKFSLDFTSIGTCEYNRSAAANGSLATDVSGQEATVAMSEQEWTKVGGGALCPNSGKLDMTFKLSTAGGVGFFSS